MSDVINHRAHRHPGDGQVCRAYVCVKEDQERPLRRAVPDINLDN